MTRNVASFFFFFSSSTLQLLVVVVRGDVDELLFLLLLLARARLRILLFDLLQLLGGFALALSARAPDLLLALARAALVVGPAAVRVLPRLGWDVALRLLLKLVAHLAGLEGTPELLLDGVHVRLLAALPSHPLGRGLQEDFQALRDVGQVRVSLALAREGEV